MKFTLSKQGRPKVVDDWLKRHRDLGDMPDVTHYLRSFADSWEEWYISLQPKWRIPDSDGNIDIESLIVDPPTDTQTSDWLALRKGSQNGIFLLILTLGWWGLGASDQGDKELTRWASAFDDLRFVMEFLLNEEEEEGNCGGEREDSEEDGKEEGGKQRENEKRVPAKRAATTNSQPAAKRSAYHITRKLVVF